VNTASGDLRGLNETNAPFPVGLVNRDDGARPAFEGRLIEVRAGELASAVASAQAALIAAGAGIYQRGGQLVRVARLDESASMLAGVTRARGAPLIVPVSRDYLLLALSTHATFVRHDARKGAMRQIDPPSAVASMLLSAVGEWKFPELRGLASAPTIRADGSLLSEPGYDDASRLIFWNDGTVWPSISETPSREDALSALDLLHELLSEFEFSSGSRGPHASAAVSAIITACIRHAMPTAPGYGLNAHKAGSGKTTLGHTIARIATGCDPAVMPLADGESEVRKAVLAVLIASDLIVLVDNIAVPVDSSAICAALTSPIYKDRVLGESRTVQLPTSATWLFNGNNLEFVGDLTSRILMSTLDPQCERPESRSFRRDIGAYVMENRGELVPAALTVSLAYRADGEPPVDGSPSRFKEWDRLVRRPLLWLGCADPMATQAELRGNDPIRVALLAVIAAWHEAFGSEAVTVAEAIEKAAAPGQSGSPQLLEALAEVAGERNGAINARRLGRWLTRYLGRIESGRRFDDAGNDAVTCRKRYRLRAVSSVSSVSATPILGIGQSTWEASQKRG